MGGYNLWLLLDPDHSRNTRSRVRTSGLNYLFALSTPTVVGKPAARPRKRRETPWDSHLGIGDGASTFGDLTLGLKL
ncbi:hypothetical protein O181_030172 [Austropuccinia psidii MF-1]|uniref:Uncharacterized protein n=1 Tax=Austropuccinia psidii MF-1 TaxID=1389203 RepID=A0A9Q3CY30_9BASI|nr:hypothetical protein [Austropuccinia psidii MF-1]